MTPFVDELARAVVDGDSAAAITARASLVEWLQSASVSGAGVLPGEQCGRDDLPQRPDVYLISSGDGSIVYVGLALDVRHRFLNPNYGHLTPMNKCRSRHVVSDPGFEIRVLNLPLDGLSDDELALSLARSEIGTYVHLVRGGFEVVNSVATLGRVGLSRGSPVVLCDLSTGTYVMCDSLDSAGRFLGTTALPAVVHGYQRTALGHVARWATAHELEAEIPYDHRGVASGPEVLALVEAVPSGVEWRGKGRNAGFDWIVGPLSADDISKLARFSRARYARDIPRSAFNGVSWESRSGGWQCRAKMGPGSKDLWQTRRKDWVSDVDAAVFREEKIRSEGWEIFNTGRYASNADALNAHFGTARFTPW